MTIPPDPEEHAVELLGWLELPLDDAPAVIVTGVNERILPEAVGADPFLPGSLRTRLGIPDDGARYARDAYLLSALIHSRDEVHLIAGRTNSAGDPLRPSRLLFADEPTVVAERIRRYLGDETERSKRPILTWRRPRTGGRPWSRMARNRPLLSGPASDHPPKIPFHPWTPCPVFGSRTSQPISRIHIGTPSNGC